MSLFEIHMIFRHNERDLTHISEAVRAFADSVRKLGFTEIAVNIDTYDHDTPAAELAVDFASDRAAEVADELGLTVSDFKGMEPSGKTGYTVDDVRRAAK